ncbi:MAG: hypothetical protein ACODAA_06815 [Gemmatimonadota bacterium]
MTRRAFTGATGRRGRIVGAAIVLAAGFSLLPVATAPAAAQTIWHDHTRPQSVWLELNHVEFEGEGSGFMTSSNAIGGRYGLGDATAFTIEVPFGYADLDAPNESELGVGSPYLGVEYARSESFLLEAGLRLPFSATNNGAVAGFFGEFADRSEAYLDEVLTVHLIPNLVSTDENGLRTRLRGGPVIWVPTGGGDPEVILDYGGTIGFENGGFGGDVGVTGWMIVSQGDLDFGERTVFQAGAQAFRRLGDGGRVGILLRIPLDDEVENVDFSLGAKVALAVN